METGAGKGMRGMSGETGVRDRCKRESAKPHHRLAFCLSGVKCWPELDTKVLSPSLFRVKMPDSSHHFS